MHLHLLLLLLSLSCFSASAGWSGDWYSFFYPSASNEAIRYPLTSSDLVAEDLQISDKRGENRKPILTEIRMRRKKNNDNRMSSGDDIAYPRTMTWPSHNMIYNLPYYVEYGDPDVDDDDNIDDDQRDDRAQENGKSSFLKWLLSSSSSSNQETSSNASPDSKSVIRRGSTLSEIRMRKRPDSLLSRIRMKKNLDEDTLSRIRMKRSKPEVENLSLLMNMGQDVNG